MVPKMPVNPDVYLYNTIFSTKDPSSSRNTSEDFLFSVGNSNDP